MFCPDGEIGRRKRLKISRGQPRAGSSPAPGTISVVLLPLQLFFFSHLFPVSVFFTRPFTAPIRVLEHRAIVSPNITHFLSRSIAKR